MYIVSPRLQRSLLSVLSLSSFLLPCALAAQPAQWSRIKIETLYETWHNAAPPYSQYSDVVNLLPTTFTNQTLANPHVQYGDSPGDWLIMCYGDNNLGNQSLYDAIYIMKRQASNGYFSIPTGPVLSYPPNTPDGYLGAGAGFTKTPVAT